MSGTDTTWSGVPGAELAARGVDLWDSTAHLESSGISAGVARRHGYASVFDLAGEARGRLAPDRTPGRPPTEERVSLVAAVQRSLMMLGGVIICVTTLPEGAAEGIIFVIAAGGWMAAQIVSAAIWFAWSRGRLADGVRAAAVIGVLTLVAGVVGAVLSAQWSVLVWVGWAVAIPVLQVLVPGWRLTLAVIIGAVVCGLAWLSWEQVVFPHPSARSFGTVAALSLTGAALALAAALVARRLRSVATSDHPGTPAAVAVAGLQAGAQLAMLLMIFLQVGPEAFGSVAVAALAAGVLADPLFVAARKVTRWVTHRSSSWWIGRLQIAIAGIVVVAVLVYAAGEAATLLLARPYHVYLNEENILIAAMIVGGVIAATNVMLRTGSAVGAMVVAVVAALLTSVTLFVPNESTGYALVLLGVLGAVLLVAVGLASSRLTRPASW